MRPAGETTASAPITTPERTETETRERKRKHRDLMRAGTQQIVGGLPVYEAFSYWCMRP